MDDSIDLPKQFVRVLNDGRYVYHCEVCGAETYRQRQIKHGRVLCIVCGNKETSNVHKRATERWLTELSELIKADLPDEYDNMVDTHLVNTIDKMYNTTRKYGTKYR